MNSAPANPNEITVTYAFPDIGEVSATLHNESAEIYRYFESIGEIERLEHLDHLGKLRAVHKTAHYSRWEYVMLQLFSVDALKKAAVAPGLSQKVEIGDREVSSGEELIKCWILLLNFCHLEGVLDAERVWMDLLLEDPQLKAAFLAALPSETARHAAARALESENFYTIHKFLGLILLCYPRKTERQQEWPRDLWKTIIESTLEPAPVGSKVAVCRNIFERVRKLVFLALDLNHCPLGIRINPVLLLNRVKERSEEFLHDEESVFSQQMEALERILFSNVYAEPVIVKYRLDYSEHQKTQYRALVKKRGKSYVIGSPESLSQSIRHARIDDFGKMTMLSSRQHYLRLAVLPHPILPFDSIKYHTEQRWLDHEAGLPDWRFTVTPTAFSDRSGCMIDVFAPPATSVNNQVTICWTLVQYITRFYDKYWSDEIMGPMAYAKYIEALFGHILRMHMKNGLRFRFERYSSPHGDTVDLAMSAESLRAWRRRFAASIRQSALAGDRVWELESVCKLTRREKGGSFLISACRIRVFDGNWKSVAEFDGVYFRVERHSLCAVFVEAKRGVSLRSKQARNDLKDAIDAAITPQHALTIKKRKGVAYAEVRLR